MSIEGNSSNDNSVLLTYTIKKGFERFFQCFRTFSVTQLEMGSRKFLSLYCIFRWQYMWYEISDKYISGGLDPDIECDRPPNAWSWRTKSIRNHKTASRFSKLFIFYSINMPFKNNTISRNWSYFLCQYIHWFPRNLINIDGRCTTISWLPWGRQAI